MLAAILLTLTTAIDWDTRLDRASAAARESHQPLLVEFWSRGCAPCQEMDRDVYADPRVAEAMRAVRPVRIDIDREPGVARRYEVTATPTLILTDSYGRELLRYAGSLPVERMLRLLDALPRDVRRLNELAAAIDARPDGFASLDAYGRALRDAGFYRTSTSWLEKALKTRDGRQRDAARTGVLVALARNALDLRLYAQAEKRCRQALDELADRPDAAGLAAEIRRDLERATRARPGG